MITWLAIRNREDYAGLHQLLTPDLAPKTFRLHHFRFRIQIQPAITRFAQH